MEGVKLKESDFRESFRFFISECCNAYFEEVLTEDGRIEFKCEKCGKVCGFLDEKYHFNDEFLPP